MQDRLKVIATLESIKRKLDAADEELGVLYDDMGKNRKEYPQPLFITLELADQWTGYAIEYVKSAIRDLKQEEKQ